MDIKTTVLGKESLLATVPWCCFVAESALPPLCGGGQNKREVYIIIVNVSLHHRHDAPWSA